MEKLDKILHQTMQDTKQMKSISKNGIEKGFEAFLNHAKKLEPNYVIDSNNEDAIKMLVAYFQGNPGFSDMYDFPNDANLKKGIFLMGRVGTGKTLIMQVFSDLMKMAGKFFPIITCRSIARKFQIEGFQSLNNLGSGSYKTVNDENYDKIRIPLTKCFDDLGCESDSYHFGNKVNVMQEVIFDRYDELKNGMITHMTTNLSVDEIKDNYSDRAYSRMKQMFNIVVLKGNDRRS